LNMKKLTLIILLAFSAIVLSACGSNGAALNNWPGLAADAARAYLAAGSFIYAVDLETGREVWRYPAESDSKHIYFATPVLTSDGQLLISSEGSNHAFTSVDPETGKENWIEPFAGAKGAWVASPLVLNETIYAPNTDGFVYVLDMKGAPSRAPIEIGGALWSAPTTDGTNIYVTSLDHQLHIIDPATEFQSDPIDLGGAAPSSPSVAADGVYVGSFASTIEYVQSSGRHEVVAEAANWIWGAPALKSGTLYYADLTGNVYSFDIEKRKQNWGGVKPDGPVVANLLIVGDHIYVATEAGTLVALDPESKVLWEKAVGGKIYTSPVAASDLILVAPYQAEFALAAYDAEGKQAWTFTPAK